MNTDPLREARGLTYGLAAGCGLWLLIAAVVVAVAQVVR